MVKFSLCLIKPHTMKRGRGIIVSHILTLQHSMEVSSHPYFWYQLCIQKSRWAPELVWTFDGRKGLESCQALSL